MLGVHRRWPQQRWSQRLHQRLHQVQAALALAPTPVQTSAYSSCAPFVWRSVRTLWRRRAVTTSSATGACFQKSTESSAARCARAHCKQTTCCQMCQCDALWQTCRVFAASMVVAPSCVAVTALAMRTFAISFLSAAVSLPSVLFYCVATPQDTRQRNAHGAQLLAPWAAVAPRVLTCWTITWVSIAQRCCASVSIATCPFAELIEWSI